MKRKEAEHTSKKEREGVSEYKRKKPITASEWQCQVLTPTQTIYNNRTNITETPTIITCNRRAREEEATTKQKGEKVSKGQKDKI
jgi:hypothetical protein